MADSRFAELWSSQWRVRLREAIHRSGRTQAAIASEAGITPQNLSHILNHGVNARFETIVRLVYATGETVGWLLGERGYEVTERERHILRSAAATILRLMPDEPKRA